MKSVQYCVVGAGMSGLVTALGLAKAGYDVALIDPHVSTDFPQGIFQSRVSALSLQTIDILQEMGAWKYLQPERLGDYTDMHVWDQDSFGSIDFDATDIFQDRLGVIVENQHVCAALMQCLSCFDNASVIGQAVTKITDDDNGSIIHYGNDMLKCAWLIGADGANSIVRKHAAMPAMFDDYEQLGIVATIKTNKPHLNTAWQVFTPDGPLAFLPLADKNMCSIVWSQKNQRAKALMTIDETTFEQALYVAFDGKLGQVKLLNERKAFPLRMQYAKQWLSENKVLVGDAAHTIHPLAGQGANLSIADAHALIKAIEQAEHSSMKQVLRAYERGRKTESVKMIAAMQGFNRLFSNKDPLTKMVRGIGLSGVNKVSAFKQIFMRLASGTN